MSGAGGIRSTEKINPPAERPGFRTGMTVTRVLKDTDPSPLSVCLLRRDRVRQAPSSYVGIAIRDFDRPSEISAGQIRFGGGVASTDGVGHDNNE